MLVFVAALLLVSFASGVWCAAETASSDPRVQPWQGGSIVALVFLLAVVVGGAAFLRFLFVPAHHAIYVDEPWYAEAACNLVRLGRLVVCEATWSGEGCVPYEKAPGWPVILAAWIWLGGCATSTGIDINRVLGSATVLLVAIAIRCAGGSWWQGLLAATILAIHPVHVAWSATGETNVSAAAALLAGLCGAILYLRTGLRPGAALAISAFGLSTAIRPECFLPVAVSAVVTALAARVRRTERLVVGGAILTAGALALAAGLDLWAMNESISGGAFLSAGNMGQNLFALARIDSIRVHGVVFLVALGGAVSLARWRDGAAAFLLAGNAIAAAVAVLAYDRFAERMLLTATVAALPLGGFAFGHPAPGDNRGSIHRIAAAGVLLVTIVLFWHDALLSASMPPETQLLETRIASRIGATPFPRDSLFVTAQPAVLAATGMTQVMATEQALREKSHLERAIGTGRSVYFLCDMFCEKNFGGATAPSPCIEILEGFALSPVVRETLNGRTYALYRITGPRDSSVEAPDCPRPSRSGGSGIPPT